MMAYECGDDIIVVDMGVGFPGEVITGVQYLLPNPQWLVENQKRIRGLILTHGHMDHTGAIPHLLPKIGFPPVYSLPLTIGLVKRRLEEFTLSEKPKFIAVGADDTLRLGNFRIRFFRVNHSIPDGVGLSITTPVGQIIHTGDWKLDYTPGDDQPAELNKLARFADEGVLALLSDSTNSRIPDYSISEQTLASTINTIFDEAKARILFTCNALILTRIQQVFYAAARHNRKVLVLGRSMLNNIEVAISLGYLKVPPALIVKAEQARKLPDKSLVILTTGGQGEELAGLPRGALFRHPVMTVEKVSVCKRDGQLVSCPQLLPAGERPGTAALLRLTAYTSGAARHDGQPVHRAIARQLGSAGITGVTTWHGIWGFHGDHAPHGGHFPHLARHVPSVTTVTGTPERICAAFGSIDALTAGRGLVTAETVLAVRPATDDIRR